MKEFRPDEMSVGNLRAELQEYEDTMPVEIDGLGRVTEIEVRADGVLVLKGRDEDD